MDQIIKPAIEINSVSKIYSLYSSKRDLILDQFNIFGYKFKPNAPIRKFTALSDININIDPGSRVGIIGRNGAGKTTLLKLINKTIMPSSGSISISGEVRALMSSGIGFHPDFTCVENIKYSLLENPQIKDNDINNFVDEVLEFCELGDFALQPFKSLSLGMQARLMFAASTVTVPEIIIIDEVLGAGDAYFIAKSRERIDKLLSKGSTVIVVSHSLQQIAELCNRVIWLHEGHIHEDGNSFSVIKNYEKYIHSLTSITTSSLNQNNLEIISSSSTQTTSQVLPEQNSKNHSFLPDLSSFEFVSRTGLSRWSKESELLLEITGFTILDHENNKNNKLRSAMPFAVMFKIKAHAPVKLPLRYGISIQDYSGKVILNQYSPEHLCSQDVDKSYIVRLDFDRMILGSGSYNIGIGVLASKPIESINSAHCYDLLNKSFEIEPYLPESLAALDAVVVYEGSWSYHNT